MAGRARLRVQSMIQIWFLPMPERFPRVSELSDMTWQLPSPIWLTIAFFTIVANSTFDFIGLVKAQRSPRLTTAMEWMSQR
jgi:hypothetical protein